jgi:maltose-binding protein MalE
MATQAAHVPTNQNVYNNPEVNRLADVIAFRAQAQNAVALPNTAAMSSVWGPATTAMDLALRDYESPTSALRRAQEEIAADIKAP